MLIKYNTGFNNDNFAKILVTDLMSKKRRLDMSSVLIQMWG